MSKKALVIIGLAGVIALSTGVVTYVGTRDRGGPPSDDPTTVSDTPSYTEYLSEVPSQEEETLPPDTETTAPTTPADSDVNGYKPVLTSAGTYRIRRVYDHASGSEITAREVFGKLYSYCSLRFDQNGTFELCINPTSGEVRRGTYAVYADVISVEYNDGKGSEFGILADSPGEIDYVLVNYGDYDVYFGLQ